ncbi:uncharacterized protein G2W53_033504 [Senna tora]|uniref:Uncharacterized protein n=1 Tax=Senna tora TaxID=362788 RepID=A0A834SXM5_9FABA|nr:uncharacterized protein G2W53_033504 [Senna tora]
MASINCPFEDLEPSNAWEEPLAMVADSCESYKSAMHMTKDYPSIIREVSAMFNQRVEQPHVTILHNPHWGNNTNIPVDCHAGKHEFLLEPSREQDAGHAQGENEPEALEQRTEETLALEVSAISLIRGKKVGATRDDEEERELDE